MFLPVRFFSTGNYCRMGPENTEQHLPPGQSKKLLAFGLIAALTSLPITGTLASMDWVERAGELFYNALISFLEFVASIVAQAIFGSLGYIFTAGTEEFLFFTPPGQIPSLRSVWFDFVPIFWAIISLGGLVFFLGMMLFPEKEEADIYRFMERVLVAGIALLLMGPMFTFQVPVPSDSPVIGNNFVMLDLLSASIFAVNEIGAYIFPDEFTLRFMQGSINSIMGGLTALSGVAASIAAVALLGWKFALGVLLVVGTFYIVLAMRMLLIYTVYAMMPLFLALWVVDIGPLKYGKMVASMVFKLTAVLLLLGIIISGILATTSAIAGQDNTDDLNFTDGYNDAPSEDLIGDDGEIDDSETEDMDGGDHASTEAPSGFSRVLLQLFAWFGGLVLSIAMTTSLLGMVISMRGGSGTSSRMRQGRSPDAPTGPQVFGGGGSGGGGAGTAGAGAAGGGFVAGGGPGGGMDVDASEMGGGAGGAPIPTNPNEATITRSDEATFINPANSDEKVVMDDDGGASSFETDTGPEEVSLRDKASHAGKKAGSKTSDVVESKTGVDLGEKASSVREAGQSVYDRVPAPVKKAGNLSKRAGGAYWSVFKQPDVASSLGEAHRIARESPIGHPDKGGSDGEGGAVDPEDSTNIPEGGPDGDDDGPDDTTRSEADGEDVNDFMGEAGGSPDDSESSDEVHETDGENVDTDGEDVESELGSADDLNLPEGKDSVVATLEDHDISSPAGHEGFTKFEQKGGNEYGGSTGQDTVDVDGGDSVSGSSDSNRPEDLNLPEGKDSVVATLEDHDISSPAGHEGFTKFEQKGGNGYSEKDDQGTVVVDGNNSVSGSSKQ